MTPEARRHLQRLLTHAHAAHLTSVRLSREDIVPSTLAHAGGSLEALRALGAISDDEFVEWNERFLEAVGIKPSARPEPPTGEEDADESGRGLRATATAQAVLVRTPVPEPPRPQFEGDQFQRLIPAPGEEKPYARGRLRIIGVEEYADGIAVQWLFTLSPAETMPPQLHALADELDSLDPSERQSRLSHLEWNHRMSEAPTAISVTDDAGTSYRAVSGGASGSSRSQIRGHSTFVPAPPASTTWLEIDADGVRFRMILPD